MYNDFYSTTSLVSQPSADTTWLIVSAVLAIVGGIAAYFLFVAKKNNGEYKGFVAWLHNFLNFKKYFIEMILKVLYLISAIYITLSSFSFISFSVATFFMYLIFGNILLRICYEFILMFLTIVNNTTEINEKLGAQKKEVEKSTPKLKKKSDEE